MTTPDEDRMKLQKATTHYLLAIAVCVFSLVLINFSQTPTPPPTGKLPGVKTKIKPPKFPPRTNFPPTFEPGEGTTSERSLMVDPKVNLQLCAKAGTVSVSGWGRNEIRAFIKDGSNFGFRVLQKSPKSDSPILVALVGLRKLPSGAALTTECIAADEIEIDVPEDAYLALKAGNNEMNVESIRKVGIVSDGGSITITNVAQGVTAKSYTRGSITVENSRGPMDLTTSEGNIVTFATGPNDPGDSFKANTNSGKISIQDWEYRIADVSTITGSVGFVGELLGGGSFAFRTTNGAIRLAIPQVSSCRVTATYTIGNFNSEIPLKILTEDVHPGPVKTVTGTIGKGDCILRLTTNTGEIAIRKQPQP